MASDVEYLTTTKLGEKGQVTVPKEYREAVGLQRGAPFAVVRIGSGLMLIPEQARFEELCNNISQTFQGHGIAPAEVLATLPAVRRRVYARHNGERRGGEKPRHRPKKRVK